MQIELSSSNIGLDNLSAGDVDEFNVLPEDAKAKALSERSSSASTTESQEAGTSILKAKDLDDPIDPLFLPKGKSFSMMALDTCSCF